MEDHSQRRRHWHTTETYGTIWSGVQLRTDHKATLAQGTDGDYDDDNDDEGGYNDENVVLFIVPRKRK